MKDLRYGRDDAIVALATPPAQSALAVIRTSGEGTFEKLAPLFSRPQALAAAPGHSLVYGRLMDPADGAVLDEVTLGVYRAPRSFTGQDAVEIFCHGSPAGLRRLLAALQRAGFRDAAPGEFTLRAFLAGKIDLTQAEAVHEVVSAQTEAGHRLALHRLGGALHEAIETVKRRLMDFLAVVNIQLDYAEDDAGDDLPLPKEPLNEARARLDELAASFAEGHLYEEGVLVVLAGRTNAGKSSLFNLFLREDRSIVSDEHGTTRDYVEQRVSLGGLPVRLFDTAGLRSTDSAVEAEGIRRSRALLHQAQIVLYLVDGAAGLAPEDEAELAPLRDHPGLIKVWNKIDAAQAPAGATQAPAGWLGLSAKTGLGFPALEAAIRSHLGLHARMGTGEAVVQSLRQKTLIDRARQALGQVAFALEAGLPIDMIALDLKEALDALGEITGEVSTEDMLDHMFGRFCVGK